MIRNIIFDLGGVILNIDFEQTTLAFKKLGVENFDHLFSRAVQDKLFESMEMGKIDDKTFRYEIRKLSNLDLTDAQIDSAWNAIIKDFPKERLKLLKQIAKNYRCFLLSNTNKMHYDVYQQDLRINHHIDGLESLFEKAYFSHDLGMRKPDTNIYEHVLSDSKLLAKETLFVDDSIQNIEAAQSIGIQGLYINIAKDEEIKDYFKEGKLI